MHPTQTYAHPKTVDDVMVTIEFDLLSVLKMAYKALDDGNVSRAKEILRAIERSVE